MKMSETLFPTPKATDADKGGRGELLSMVRTGHPRAAPPESAQLTLSLPDSPVRISATAGKGAGIEGERSGLWSRSRPSYWRITTALRHPGERRSVA